MRGDNASYADQLYKDALQGRFTNGFQDGYSNSQILRMYMYTQFKKDPSQFTPINNNEYFINSTFDLNTGTAIKYNKNSKTFIKVRVDPSKTPILVKKMKELYERQNPYNPQNSSNGTWGSFKKDGGKLNQLVALRNGGHIQYALSGAELGKMLKLEAGYIYNQSVKQRAIEKGVSEERIKAGDVAAKSDD